MRAAAYMAEMDAIVSLASKLGGAGFGALLLLILWGSWKNIWVWGRDVDRVTERYERLLAKSQEEAEWWRSIALKATGIAETQSRVATELAKKAETSGRERKS